MKKTLLIMAACAITTAASAQVPVSSVEKVSQPGIPTLFDQKFFKVDERQAQPARTKSTGVYYTRPKGAYFGGWGLNNRGYGATTISIVPWQEVVFENQLANKGGTWHQWYYTQAGTIGGDVLVNPEATVENGDYYWSQGPGYLYYTPTLRLNRDSFSIGDDNIYVVQANYGPAYAGRIITDSIGMKRPADDHEAYYYNGNLYGNGAAWGALDTDWMYGTGNTDVTVDDAGNKEWFTCIGVEQVVERPLSKLYIETVAVNTISHSRKPITEGDTLWCYITNVEETTNSRGELQLVAGDQVYETLFALAGDTVGFSNNDKSTMNGKTVYDGKILFSKKEIDDFGIEYDIPVVIDPADFDENGFALVFDGFTADGMDVGFEGLHYDSDVNDVEPARFHCYHPDYGAYRFYYTDVALGVGMVSMYDVVEVIGNADNRINVLRISNDGQTCSTDGAVVGSDDDFGGAAVYTAVPWYDEDLNDNYFIEDSPEWVKTVYVDESMRRGDSQGNYVGLDFVSFSCDPLPAGVSGRYAVVHVTGHGVVSETPIIILQGDATYADGINSVATTPKATTGRIYNLSGQQTSKSSKGVLIQDGKKFMNK